MAERKYHNGDECFHTDRRQENFNVCDFWHFAFGDLLDNTYRGRLAEFLVAKALGLDTSTPRADWSEYDLLYNDIRIEVKSAAYLQSWNLDNEKYSSIRFSVSSARRYDANRGYVGEKSRHSDFYVFCVYEERNKRGYDILDLSKWSFFLVSTAVIEKNCGERHSIALPALQRCATQCTYDTLKLTLDTMLTEKTV